MSTNGSRKWDNYYQRHVQSAFRYTEKAVTNMPVVGFSEVFRKCFSVEVKFCILTLHLPTLAILTKCNSGSSNNIKKDEVYIFLVFTYWHILHIYVNTYFMYLWWGRASFLCRMLNFSRFISVISQIQGLWQMCTAGKAFNSIDYVSVLLLVA